MKEYHRRVIRIDAHDSPNVALGLAQQARGQKPTGKEVVPGVLSWDEYQARLATWDEVRKCVGLWAKFWQGADLLLFPPTWLDLAEQRAAALGNTRRYAKAIGVDPAEGGDKTAMAVIDELGIIELKSRKTPDTTQIIDDVVILMHRYHVPPDKVCFDRGGGGKQLADRMRQIGYPVQTVAFGESLTPEPQTSKATVDERQRAREQKVYVNRRAQMYGSLSEAIDPTNTDDDKPRWAIPTGICGDKSDSRTNLRSQLAPIPKLYDSMERIKMLPKRNPLNPDDQRTLIKLIGHSPDEADAVVIARHVMLTKPTRKEIQVF